MPANWLLALVVAASMAVAGVLPQRPVPVPQDRPARDVVRESRASGTIRGRVTAAATGQPLHRVRITVNGTAPEGLTAVTDARGVFEITDVPAGSFTITAARAGYRTIPYGYRRPHDTGRTITLESGQTVEGIDIALPRGAVLAGRITDEQGEPAPGTRVEAVAFQYIRGRRVAVATRLTNANDVGEYRLANLEPGAYQIRGSSRDLWTSDDGQATFTYALTYFPGVTAADRPQTVNVSTGQQVTGLDFALVPGRAARITGIVENANGEPQAGQVVNLDNISRTVGGALASAGPGGTTKTDAAGAFDFPSLPAGEYRAYSGGPNDRVGETVVVQAGDSKHIVLAVRKPTLVAGTLVTDDGTPLPFPASRVTVWPIATDPDTVLPIWGGPREASVGSDRTFRLANLDGQYLFRVTGLPDDWVLKDVTLGRRQIIDQPLTVRRGTADVLGLQIVVSRGGSRMTGAVVDRAGASAPDVTVVVFAEDRALWGPGSRFIRTARPDRSGRFSVGGLLGGAYRVIGVDAVDDGQWEDPAFLDSLFKRATKVLLADGASEKITLTVITEATS